MNIELLTKLVKLANNNPNEHEANAAARKVCLIIAEAKFKFSADLSATGPIPNPYDTGNDLYNMMMNFGKQDPYYKSYIFICSKCRKNITTNSLLEYRSQ